MENLSLMRDMAERQANDKSTPSPTASVHELPWNTVRELCRNRLGPVDFNVVCAFGSVEELVKYGVLLQQRYKQTSKAYELSRLTEFFQQLRTFHSSFDVLVHVQPTIAAPVWGSIRLCVELMHETSEAFQLIIDMFDEINHTLPRIGTYVECLGESQTLVDLSREIYLAIAEFACQVIVYFRKHPLKNLFLTTWKPFRPDFEKSVSKIRQKSRQIELEAQTLSLQQNASRHEEITRLLSAVELKSRTNLPCHHVPWQRNPAFIGRDDVLGEIQKQFSAPFNEQRVVTLYGLGGVGKTQICLEYISRHTEEYQAIFWVSADSVIKLTQDIRVVLIKLNIISETSKDSGQQCWSLFDQWLRDTDVKWLLVFDNADNLKTLQGYWPSSEKGDILLSSRDPAAARLPVSAKPVKGFRIPPLSEESGADLFLGLLHHETEATYNLKVVESSRDTVLARALVKELGGLPLAIQQIANYTLESGCNLEEVVEVYSDFRNRASLLDQDPGYLHMDYAYSLSTVWSISMSQVKRSNPNASHLLELLSIFDSDGVPESLFTKPSEQAGDPTPPRIKYLDNKMQYLNARKPLLQQSMIYKNMDERVLSMHRLVAAITSSTLDPENRQARFDDALELVYRVFPQVTTERAFLDDRWPQCRLYMPQVVSLEKFFRESEPPLLPRAHFAALMANASWFLFETGFPAQAMELLPTALSVGEKTVTGNEQALMTIHRAFGGIYLDINKPQAAFDNFSSQLSYAQKIAFPDSLGTAHGFTNVALAELSLSKYDSARKHLERAQEIRSAYPGQAESYRAMTLDVVGIMEGLSGNYEAGVRKLEEAIKLYDDDLGVGNYLTAFAQYSLGNIYLLMDSHREAFKLHAFALSVRRDLLGETYRTAASLHKVAWFLHGQGDPAGASELLTKALGIYSNVYEGKGGIGRSSYLMSLILTSLKRDEDSRNTKALAESIRHELIGIPPGKDDNLASYDMLVGVLDR